MRLLTFVLGSALLVASCGDVHTPGQDIAPSPAVDPARSTTPARIQLSVGSRSDQRLDIAAQVLSADGHGVPNVTVTFSLGAGAGFVDPTTAKTDSTGTAKTIATATAVTTLTADIGSGISSSFNITIPSAAPLSVSITAGSATTGQAATMSARVTGLLSGSSVVSYAWTFGDGGVDTTTTSTASHAYAQVGTYPLTVIITDSLGRTANGSGSIGVAAPPTPAPAPGSGTSTLTITLTCTAQAAHGTPATPTPCNVSAAYGTTNIASNAITKVDWDWGDGAIQTVNNSPLGSHNFTQAGKYIVNATVTATTTDGAKTASATQAVTIN